MKPRRSEKWFQQTFDSHYKEMVLYAQRYLNDISESEDIVQEIFIQLWENRAANNSKKLEEVKKVIYVMPMSMREIFELKYLEFNNTENYYEALERQFNGTITLYGKVWWDVD